LSLEISDLGLSIAQLNEIEELDPTLVTAWLIESAKPNVRSPGGFFLTGIRSGKPPTEYNPDPDRARLVLLAERWIERVGLLYDRESDVIGELFEGRGLLRHYAGDVQLQTRMLDLWTKHRPLGEQVEREFVERNARHGAAYHATMQAMREVRKGGSADDQG